MGEKITRRLAQSWVLLVLFAAIFASPAAAFAVDYYLPWTQGKTFQCTQGNFGSFSHYDKYNKYAWDFGLGFGEPVRASAGGTVIGLRRDAADFVPSPNINTPVNYVLISHADGTRTGYYHLKQYSIPSDIQVGTSIRGGQVIGAAGCSGFSTDPHLHFSRYDTSGYSIALTFKEAGVPVSGASYTSGNVEQGAVVHYNPIAPGDPGFARYGAASGWSNIGGGWYGTGIYTWNGNGTRDNYGRWTFDLGQLKGSRRYKAEAYVTSTHAGTEKADYHINTSSGIQHAVVNQNILSNQWADLGSYSFASGSTWIELDDVTGEAALTKEIALDAIRLTPYFTLTYTPGSGGTITGSASQSVISAGSGSAVTAAPKAGYRFVSWSDGVTTAARTDKGVSADKSVSAAFAPLVAPTYRLQGTDRYATAIAASRSTFGNGACAAVVIATGGNYPDALSAAGLAGAVDAPVLLVAGDTLRSDIRTEIQRVTKGKASFKVYIMGSTSAVSAKMEASIAAAFTNESIERFSGTNRFHTSQLVAAKIKALRGASFGDRAILVTGGEYVDGLLVGPAAFAAKVPILLVRTTADTALVDSLKSLGVKNAVVLGTTARIPVSLETSLKSSVPGLATRRVSTLTDTYARSAAAADYFATPANGFGLTWGGAGIATGERFPDGLGAGCAEGKRRTTLLLTRCTSLPSPIAARISTHKRNFYSVRLYGSTSAVSGAVETAVKNLLK